jgi:hypothetical protein
MSAVVPVLVIKFGYLFATTKLHCMKIIKWIGHPVILIIIYLLLIIEGDEFGGFYLLYLVLSLPHLVPYSVLAAAGIAGLIIAFNLGNEKYLFIKPFLYLFGFGLMVFSLILFFSKGNKEQTFHLSLPLMTFVIFAISSLCFLVYAASLFQKESKNANRSMVA